MLLLQVVMRYHGHQQEVRLLLSLGDQLISADSGGDVIVWDVQGGGEQQRVGLHVGSPACWHHLSCYPSCLAPCVSQTCTYGCSLTRTPSTCRPWCTRVLTWTRCCWAAPRVHCSCGTLRPGEFCVALLFNRLLEDKSTSVGEKFWYRYPAVSQTYLWLPVVVHVFPHLPTNCLFVLSKLLFTFPGWSAGVTALQQVAHYVHTNCFILVAVQVRFWFNMWQWTKHYLQDFIFREIINLSLTRVLQSTWLALARQQATSSFTTSDWMRRWWASLRTGDQSARSLLEQVKDRCHRYSVKQKFPVLALERPCPATLPALPIADYLVQVWTGISDPSNKAYGPCPLLSQMAHLSWRVAVPRAT